MDYRYNIITYHNFEDKIVNAVVEIPKFSNNKYEIDEKSGEFLTVVRKLSNKPFRRYFYPFNYGFIPSTLADDKDQLDCIILGGRVRSLSVLKCKVVGVIKTVDNGEQDDKIILIPIYNNNVKKVKLNRVIRFLKKYKYPDNKSTIIEGVFEADEANKIIQDCMIKR